MRFKRTKIVATLGPTSSSPRIIERLIENGMNVARFNFSHGSHEDHAKMMRNVRVAAKKLGEPITMFQDLAGPKVRLGEFAEGSITLVPGQAFTLSTKPCIGSERQVFIDYPHLHKEAKKGDIVMLDDGRRKLVVTSVRGTDVLTTVVIGGTIVGRRGVNMPGGFRKVPALTAKDRTDLSFGLSQEIDFVAISFVKRASDVTQLRGLIAKHVPKNVPGIISKIETPEAVENIDSIIAASDGIMVARGDLAVEVPPENVPFIQKQIVSKCVAAGKPVIVATQMLESMIHSPVPTRAEVGDVANAVLDGTDAVMLSQETAMGEFPVEALSMMAQIARKTENDSIYRERLDENRRSSVGTADAIGRAVVTAADAIDSKAIVALSDSGYTAHMISRYRPMRPIIVLTPHAATQRKLALTFACHPYLTNSFEKLLPAVTDAKRIMLREKLVTKGDTFVIAAGIPLGKASDTNTMMVQKV
jgi:pyruvate kinase